jgi:hypothetical protein
MASLFLPRQCYSDTYYKYVDKDGTACFTDNPQSIPEKYKKKTIKIVDGKEDRKEYKEYVDKKSKDAQRKADNEDGPSIDKKQEVSSEGKVKDAVTAITNSKFFILVLAIAIFVSLFIVIGKIGRSLGHRQISFLLRIALTVGILVFLFFGQVEKMADVFTSLKKGVSDIGKRLEKKNEKAEDTAKNPLEPGSVCRQAKIDRSF